MDWQALQSLPDGVNKTGLQVKVSGVVNKQHYWLLDNQIYQGQVGYDLLAAAVACNYMSH